MTNEEIKKIVEWVDKRVMPNMRHYYAGDAEITEKGQLIDDLREYLLSICDSSDTEKAELNMYRKRYGILGECHPSIWVTKSNLQKECIRIEDIERYDVCEGVYEGNQYHTMIYCRKHTYYVVETVEEIANLINKHKQLFKND